MPGLVVRITVTGASGFVARHLRGHLLQNGVDTVSISRNNFALLKGEQKIISQDYEKGVLSGIRGSDALIHLVGIGRQSVQNRYGTVNTGITENVIRLCKKAGIKRIIYLSGLGVSSGTQLEYFISKYNAEQMIKKSGLDYVIFRPSYIVGGDDPLSCHLKKQIKNKVIEIPGSGRYSFQPIHIGDVAQILLDSATKGRFRNKTLDLVGPERITFGKYVRLFSPKTRIQKIDLEKAYHTAMTSPGQEPGVDDLNIMVGSFEGNHEKLADTAGIKFQSVVNILKSGRLF
ncbi:MAG: NAD-dependent epimerase/dehydratase family protein [Nitrosopumilus sp. B06]|nr:MAG: NAD-dependent epimerase/dehydratase family protein [Nitrosopumilus sp. B06]